MKLVIYAGTGQEICLYGDGGASVELNGMRAAGHSLVGAVHFDADGSVQRHTLQDALPGEPPLSAKTVETAVRLARYEVRRARQEAAGVLAAHKRAEETGGAPVAGKDRQR
jgi:hypothetical protein